MGLRVRLTWIQIPAQPFTSYVRLDSSVPHYTHMLGEEMNNPFAAHYK